MTTLNQDMIKSISNNDAPQRLVIDSVQFSETCSNEEYWQNVYDAFSANTSIFEIWFVGLNSNTIEPLAKVLTLPNRIGGLSLENIDMEAIINILPILRSSDCHINGLGLRSLADDAVEQLLPFITDEQSNLSALGIKDLNLKPTEIILTNLHKNNGLEVLGLVSLSDEVLEHTYNFLKSEPIKAQIFCSEFISKEWQEKFKALQNASVHS